jgi:predicted DsbA family dithiol-disulfide isomerase
VDALFEAYFTQGLDVGDGQVLRNLAIKAGMEEAVADAILTEERVHAAVKEQAKGYGEAGISGVPTVLYDTQDGQIFGLFSGAQEPKNIRNMLVQLADELANQEPQ